MSGNIQRAPRAEVLRRGLVSSGYEYEVALQTAEDLAVFSPDRHGDLYVAVEAWLAGVFPLPDAHEGKYSAARLVAGYGMTYPAALITIGWLRDDPVSAEACLASRGAV